MSDLLAAPTSPPSGSDGVDDLKLKRTNRGQKLYNDLRDAETNQHFDSQLRLRGRFRDKRKSRRRRDSMNCCASQCSHATSSTAASGQAPTESRASGRHGPLPELIRAKAAFTRNIGACVDCRIKKIGCKHWVLDDFEAVYQEVKRTTSEAANVGQERASDDTELAAATSHSSQIDLLGLEQSPSVDLMATAMSAEISELLDSSVTASNEAVNKTLPVLLPRLGTGSAHTWTGGFSQSWIIDDGEPVAIGQQLTTSGGTEWECRFHGEGTGAPGFPRVHCNARFATTNDLQRHFSAAHFTVKVYEPAVWFQCRQCALLNDEDWYCLQCGLLEGECGEQDQWVYGYAVGSAPQAAWNTYIDMLAEFIDYDDGWLGYTAESWEEVCERNALMLENDMATQDWMTDTCGSAAILSPDIVSLLWPAVD